MNRMVMKIIAGLLSLSLSTAVWLRYPVKARISPPAISAKACVLMDAKTGQVLYAKQDQEKLPMASTTKIMTTLLTLESGGLEDPFVVDPQAIQVEGSSMGLQVGDVVTKYALCVGMLLPSGNDAANAAAVAVAGNVPKFLEKMNQRAAVIGMTRTCFASPSGLDAQGHGSSAYDMALLTREALQNPLFREICKSASRQVCFGNPPYLRTLTNTNKLLKMDETIIGVKTGFTDAAGRCLVSACERDGGTLICVTLDDKNDWADHLALYDYGFSDAKAYTIPLPTQLSLPIEGGTVASVSVYAREPLILTAWHGIPADVQTTCLLPPFLTAPLEKGEPVGVLLYTTEQGLEIARLPLYTAEPIASMEPAKETRFWVRILDWIYGAA